MHCEKKEFSLNWISSVSLSLSITLSPCALLNSIKESSSAERRGTGGWGFGEKQGKKGEDGEGKDFNIWFPHLKYINLSYPEALLKSRERKGRDGRRERKRSEGTYDIFIVESCFYCFYGQHIAQRFHMPSWPHKLQAAKRSQMVLHTLCTCRWLDFCQA